MSELYKVLGPNAESIHGGTGQWHKPKGKRPGKWMTVITDPRCCQRGYHLVELQSLPGWLTTGCTIYLAEGRGGSHTDGLGKTAFAQARLIRRIGLSEQDLRLFAADCAEHVLPIWRSKYPDDGRLAKAIEATRQFARGEIDDAARAAAWTAAEAAAWAAAEDAAVDAAWAAARAAARVAAKAAAWAAAWAAAGAAAWAAAGAAAWAADAARAAAWAAERQWQGEVLRGYLRDAPPIERPDDE
jgi:Immunity protein Imm5